MTAPTAPQTGTSPTDAALKEAILRYKELHAQVEALAKKVSEEEKRVAALLDQHKVKKLLKDIISQTE